MSSSRSHAPLSGCSAPQQDVARRPVAAARRLEHVREALAPARDAVDRAGVPGAREVLGREEEDPHLAHAQRAGAHRTPAPSCACRRRDASTSRRTHKRRRDNNFNYCYNTKDPPSNRPSFSSSVSSSRRALPFFSRAASTTNPPRARRASRQARRRPPRPRQCPRSLF